MCTIGMQLKNAQTINVTWEVPNVETQRCDTMVFSTSYSTKVGREMCLAYQELNKETQKDHFPFPFINQVLDILSKK